MSVIPTLEQNPAGLHVRYKVEKCYGENDPRAVYFVLRLDRYGDDPKWTAACRVAARSLAMEIESHLPGLSRDLYALAEILERDKS